MFIEPHAHMVSRTTDDYRQMALAGCVAISEPAFWAGFDRLSPDGFEGYFRHLTEFEPSRAAQYGIKHFCWMCLNPKEGEDRKLAKEVLKIIPKYLELPNVIGVGEIGVNRVTKNELATFCDHVSLALEYNQLILIHTPHLEDKYKGTKVLVDALLKFQNLNPGRVMMDHAEEHTIDMILQNGFCTGLTLYPETKVSIPRAADIIEKYGADRIYVNSACDWGHSLPLAVPMFMMEMRRRGHEQSLIHRVVYENPLKFMGQSPKFVV
jgi:uncharacterized protein